MLLATLSNILLSVKRRTVSLATLLATLSNILFVKRRTVSLASPFWHVARHLSVKTVAPIFCTAFTPTTTYIPTYFTTHILPTKYLPTVANTYLPAFFYPPNIYPQLPAYLLTPKCALHQNRFGLFIF